MVGEKIQKTVEWIRRNNKKPTLPSKKSREEEELLSLESLSFGVWVSKNTLWIRILFGLLFLILCKSSIFLFLFIYLLILKYMFGAIKNKWLNSNGLVQGWSKISWVELPFVFLSFYPLFFFWITNKVILIHLCLQYWPHYIKHAYSFLLPNAT